MPQAIRNTHSAAHAAVRILRSASSKLSGALALFAGIAAIALLLLVCANAGFRFLGLPIRGAVESSGIFCAIAAALALGSAQTHGNHICGGIAASRLPRPLRFFLNIACLAAGCAFFLLCAWEVADIGLFALETGEVIDGLGALYPWCILMTVPGFLGHAAVIAMRLSICLITGKD